MNDELKAVRNLGTELGAAKAEVERLREALRPFAAFEEVRSKQGGCTPKSGTVWAVASAGGETEITVEHLQAAVAALSQQAEPTDTYTATDMINQSAQGFRDGQAAVEQAAAQDEREAFEARMILEAGPGAADLWIKGNPGAGYSNERVNDHRFGWVACLEWMATRPAQTEQQPVAWLHSRSGAVATESTKRAMEDGSVPSGYDIPLYTAPIAQTAPQPGQSGLAGRLNSVIAELKGGFVACQRCGDQEDTATLDCVPELEAIAAALSAQGQSNGDS